MKKYIYKKFASFYDEVNNNDFYDHYFLLIKKIIKENKIKKVRLLDLACGTGRLIQKLKPFCSIIEGVDFSEEMLKIAKGRDKKIRYYNQNFLSFNTKKKYQVIISTFDSINYLTTKRDLEQAFKNIAKHLIDNGFFIFDFNTVHKKLKKEIKKGDIIYHNLIKNKYWFITLEIKKGEKTFKEYHKERLYSFSEISSALKKNNLQIISTYSSFDKECEKIAREPRLFLVARRQNLN
jgi:ubiquinone/menaquinone biosynthesis C-methylase UbiE